MNQIKHTIERTEKNCGGHIEEEEEDDDDDEHALFSYCASLQILVFFARFRIWVFSDCRCAVFRAGSLI